MCGRANGHLDYLTEKEIGSVTITPSDAVIAGSYGTWTLTYTVGKYGLDVGGGLKIGNRRMSDWGTPQFDDPKAPNYVTVSGSTPAELCVRYDPRGYIRPFRAVIIVDVEKGALYPGDTLTVVMGDRSGGSPGRQVQTFPEQECLFAVFVDALSSGLYQRVPQVSPMLRVVTGDAEKFVLQGPSTVVAGEPFRIKVHGSDGFGNPTPTDMNDLSITTEPPVKFSLGKADGRTKWMDDIRIFEPGVQYLDLRKGDKLLARSNPIVVSEKQETYGLYWGDTQAQTASTVGTGTMEEYYQYARDVAGIDFCTHQANDFMVRDEDWQDIIEETKRFHEPDRFVSILGYEWSGTAGAGGDRNVLFQGDEAPIYRSSSWQVDKANQSSERPTAKDLQAAIRKYREEKNERVVLIPHIGGRRTEIESVDPELEPVLEICSCHGIFEWAIHDALERGLRIGLIAASDDHTCRPGLSYPSTPEMAVQGGLSAVYAKDLTRESILEAFSSRRCYGTTGERINVWAEADGNPMGSEFTANHAPKILVKVAGTEPLEEIILYNQTRQIFSMKPNPPQRDKRRVRVLWTGARGRDRNRYAVWDGKLTLSNGQILSAKPLNMYAPKEGIIHRDSTELSWRSITAGHQVGVLLEVDAPDDATICFETGPATFDFQLDRIRTEDLHIDAGGQGQAVGVSTLHCEGEVKQAEFDFVEKDLLPGNHAYWVRVVQTDFHRAWTSPIFVDVSN